MKASKHAAMVLMAAGLLSAPTYASESLLSQVQAAPVATFAQEDINTVFEQADKPLQLAALSSQEMKETEGAIAPLVAIGYMTATRFIVQRYVTQSVARSMVRSGAHGVMANTRAQAANIAGRGGIREFHAGPGARYTHYHTANRNGSHVWYGSPR